MHGRHHQRFMLLLFAMFSLLGLFAFGLHDQMFEGHARAAARSVTSSPPGLPAFALTPATLPHGEATALAPLLAVDDDRRFPRLAVPPSRPLEDALVVSYYGNPYVRDMGILGAGEPEVVARLVEAHAGRYDALNGTREVIPALHLVYAVAQPHEAAGDYLYYVDEADLQRYIEATQERDMLLFLDLQIGRSTVADEVERVLPYLRHPHVHLALDPEFAMPPGLVPGQAIGSITGEDVQAAQETLAQLVVDQGLPPKILIVHQFLDSMITGTDAIAPVPGVDLVIDADGYGPGDIKRAVYERYASRPYAAYAGFKLFFDWDTDLLSEEAVLALDPPPAVVIYQ